VQVDDRRLRRPARRTTRRAVRCGDPRPSVK
jgi:hypothetical protein